MLNPSYIVASALTPQVGSCTTNGNDPNLPFTNNRTNNGNQDAAGNVRWDGATTYAFDAENRITSSTRTVGSLTTAVNYKYDGDGRRVRVEVTGGASTNFVYDAGGKLLAEYNSQNYPESGTRFRIGDHLGSTRLLFDLSGNVLQRFDYLPFGEELLTSARTTALKYGVASIVKQRFTGQMRDGETNLDYFWARYLSANQGRFTSADPGNAGASVGGPQSWNGYSYTANNPLLYVDPDGLAFRICDTGGSCTDNYPDTDFYQYFPTEAGTNKTLGDIMQDGKKIGTFERLSYDDQSALGNGFIQAMSTRRSASNQMVGVVIGGSAAAGVVGGVATGTGAVAAIVDGVAYTSQELIALGPVVLARMVAAGKLSLEVIKRIGAQVPVIANQVYLRLFAQANHTTIPTNGVLNNNNYFRMGENFMTGVGPVFRVSIGSKHAPLPSWVPGVAKGALHINLWRGHWRL